ncbi:hypothetical protein BLNAU_6944 [Blattamonas nauphoetae]|uniref:Uncharacterized protein n=1 Tax=Blattamonas nauphoetae TaxID=2049346 RepID=A0ABQ9Y2Q1_9EUKA|nr:hypothetical protein BLNAU_6944 [Blattamonas nauphoetae]
MYTWADYLAHCSVTLSHRRQEQFLRLVDGKNVEWKGLIKDILPDYVLMEMSSPYSPDFTSEISIETSDAVIGSYGTAFNTGTKCKVRLKLLALDHCLTFKLQPLNLKEPIDYTLTYPVVATIFSRVGDILPDFYFERLFKGRSIILLGSATDFRDEDSPNSDIAASFRLNLVASIQNYSVPFEEPIRMQLTRGFDDMIEFCRKANPKQMIEVRGLFVARGTPHLLKVISISRPFQKESGVPRIPLVDASLTERNTSRTSRSGQTYFPVSIDALFVPAQSLLGDPVKVVSLLSDNNPLRLTQTLTTLSQYIISSSNLIKEQYITAGIYPALFRLIERALEISPSRIQLSTFSQEPEEQTEQPFTQSQTTHAIDLTCAIFISLLTDKKTTARLALESGIVKFLSSILYAQPLENITRVQVSVIYELSVGTTNDEKDHLAQFGILPSLIRLLEHHSLPIVSDVITSLFNIVAAGHDRTDPFDSHPHRKLLRGSGGMNALWKLVESINAEEEWESDAMTQAVKNRCELIIGFIYRSSSLPTKFKPVIDDLVEMTHTSSNPAIITVNALVALHHLALHDANHPGILATGMLSRAVNLLQNENEDIVQRTIFFCLSIYEEGDETTRRIIQNAIPVSLMRQLAAHSNEAISNPAWEFLPLLERQ